MQYIQYEINLYMFPIITSCKLTILVFIDKQIGTGLQ